MYFSIMGNDQVTETSAGMSVVCMVAAALATSQIMPVAVEMVRIPLNTNCPPTLTVQQEDGKFKKTRSFIVHG